MSVGSFRSFAWMWTGPTTRPLGAARMTVATQIANRITGKAQITSMSRDRSASTTPP